MTFTLHVHVVLTVRTFYYKDHADGRMQAEFITSLAHRGNKEQFSKMASAWDVSPFSSCPALMQLICLCKYRKCYAGTKERSGIADVFISVINSPLFSNRTRA